MCSVHAAAGDEIWEILSKMITVVCSDCGSRLNIPDQYAGQSGKCNHCGRRVSVPSLDPERAASSIKERHSDIPSTDKKRMHGSNLKWILLCSVLATTACVVIGYALFFREVNLPGKQARIWFRLLGERGVAGIEGIETNDGGLALMGYDGQDEGEEWQIFTVTLDAEGNSVSRDSLARSVPLRSPNRVRAMREDGYIIILGSPTYPLSPAESRMKIMKLTERGSEVWTKTISSLEQPEARTSSDVRRTSDGGFVVLGKLYQEGQVSGERMKLVKMDPDGEELWTRDYEGDGFGVLPNSVRELRDGGFMVAGSTWTYSERSDRSINIGFNMYLIRTDSDGRQLWAKSFGDDGDQMLLAAIETQDGGFILLGPSRSSGRGDRAAKVILTDANGDQVWAKTFNVLDETVPNEIVQTADGGYVVAGTTLLVDTSAGVDDLRVFIRRVNSQGEELWTKTYDGLVEPVEVSTLLQAQDGGFVLIGLGFPVGAGPDAYTDGFVLKTDQDGNGPDVGESAGTPQ